MTLAPRLLLSLSRVRWVHFDRSFRYHRRVSAEHKVGELLAAGDADRAAEEAIRGFGPKILGLLRTVLRDEDLARLKNSVASFIDSASKH